MGNMDAPARPLTWLSCLALLALGCSSAPAPRPEPAAWAPSMKGWELYSYMADGSWHYTLLPGTNRLKTWQEIDQGHPLDDLRPQLDRLPRGEEVFWQGPGLDPRLQLPPETAIAQVKAWASERGLNLHTP